VFRVFINYRTGDGEASAALLDRELSRRFGSDKIFRASKAIPPGEDFERVILKAVRRCDVLLAVIGLHWLGSRDERGRRPIDDPADWTRREILEAFRCGVTVIPVLVGRLTERLRAGDLPAELAELARCQYVRLDHRTAEADLDHLAEVLVKRVPGLRDHHPGGSDGPAAPGPNNSVVNEFLAPVDARHGVIGIANAAGRADL
jgi:hypothetical protein